MFDEINLFFFLAHTFDGYDANGVFTYQVYPLSYRIYNPVGGYYPDLKS